MIWIMVFAILFGCYVSTSTFFFKFPTFLHKKKHVKFKAVHISHRGGAGENYENTLTSFRKAVELGTDMLELDCHLTKDNKVVVSHDANLLRATGLSENIKHTDYSDLPIMKTTLPIDFLPGEMFTGSSNDRHLPLLEQVFQEFPETPINIDIKENNDALISKVSELIKSYKREEITVWGNFNDIVTQKCFKENSNVGLFFSVRRTAILLGLMYTGLLPFIPLKETHLEIFIPLQAIKLYEKRAPLKWWHITFAKVANILLIRPCLFKHLEARGIQTYAWVLNTDEEFKLAYEAGITGVMTDFPSKLKDFLDKNPQYRMQNSELN